MICLRRRLGVETTFPTGSCFVCGGVGSRVAIKTLGSPDRCLMILDSEPLHLQLRSCQGLGVSSSAGDVSTLT